MTDWVAKLNDLLAQKKSEGMADFHATFAKPTLEALKDPHALAQNHARELYKVLTMSPWRRFVGRMRGKLWIKRDRLRCKWRRFKWKHL